MSSASLDQTANEPFHPDGPVTIPPAAAHGIAGAATTLMIPPKPPHIDQLFPHPALPPPANAPANSRNRSSICSDQDIGSQPRSLAHFPQLQRSQVRSRFALVFLIDNHASHQLLCISEMGASGVVIDAAYTTHCIYQRPAFEPPGHITHGNYNEHLGDERYVVPCCPYSSLALSALDVLVNFGPGCTAQK